VTDIRQVAGASPCLPLWGRWSGKEEELERRTKKSKGGAGPWGSGNAATPADQFNPTYEFT